jgi:branched-chain amino acid transport system permease protein
MDKLLAILVDGTIYASWLFLVAAGLTLVFGVLNLLNMAHGNLYAVGAYAAATAVTLFLGREPAALQAMVTLVGVAVLVAIVVGPALERGILRLFYGRDEVVMMLATYALFLMMEDLIKLIWGVNPLYASQAYQVFGNVNIGKLPYVGYDFAIVAVAIVVGVGIWFWMNRSRFGRIVLAVIHDREICDALGVNVVRVFVVSFSIAVFLAALGGALTAPMISVQPGIGVNVILLSFAVVIIGGLGSIEGAAIGALMVGFSRAAAVHLAPVAELFIVYLVMAAVLFFRPEGLFKREQLRKI